MAGARPEVAAAADVPRRGWQVLAVTSAGVFIVFLDATVVNIAFPAISADFSGASRAGLSWILNAYAVVFGALLLTAGRLADDYGRRRVFMAGLLAFAGASVLCGRSPTCLCSWPPGRCRPSAPATSGRLGQLAECVPLRLGTRAPDGA